MKKTFLFPASIILLTVAYSQGAAAQSISLKEIHAQSPYLSSKHSTHVSSYNGALYSDKMFESLQADAKQLGTYATTKPTYDNVAPGVHSFNMAGIINMHAVETPNGLVIYDTGDNLHEGQQFYDALRKVTNKPIKAIIYSHEHYTHGAQVYLDNEKNRGNENIKIIGHHGHNASISKSLAGTALHKEVSDILLARLLPQFYTFADTKGPHAAGHNHLIDVTQEKGPVPVNTPISVDGQKITIDGVDFVFYIDGITTDTTQQLLVHIPSKDLVLNNLKWGFLPNVYSIRGGAYRNPEVWLKGLDKLASFDAKILLSTHSKSTRTFAESKRSIEVYQDGLTAILNQTLKGMLTGKKPTEIAYSVEIPQVIANEPILRQDYGELVTMVPQIYSAVLGTFNGEAADAIPMHPKAEADMIVRGMGGQKSTLKFAQGEYEKGNFLYAVRLGKYLLELDGENKANIDFQVKALYAMAESTESHNIRSWMLTKARILKKEIALPSVLPQLPKYVALDVANYVDNYRIRLNHVKAGSTRAKIGFKFYSGAIKSLEIRNGVSYARDNLDNADVVIKMNDALFTKLYNNMATISMMVEAGEAKIISGNLATAEKLLALYDVVYDWENDKGLQFLQSLMQASASKTKH